MQQQHRDLEEQQLKQIQGLARDQLQQVGAAERSETEKRLNQAQKEALKDFEFNMKKILLHSSKVNVKGKIDLFFFFVRKIFAKIAKKKKYLSQQYFAKNDLTK